MQELETLQLPSQSKGKGQMGSVWDSEAGKNLIMSIFVKDTLML
jgi:BirA family biotin operon repressor/biotin-[acetyl-CoA-carboxylase] ligase